MIILPIMAVTQPALPTDKQLAMHEFSLQNRYKESTVNTVFKDNILLTLKYSAEENITPDNINWEKVEKPFRYTLTLKPGETFAFHDDVLPEYIGKVNKTTNAHFNGTEGFKSSGYLMGDGVCHLASLLYWAARDAGLKTVAPTRHDFAAIPDVPREFGVSIYATPEINTSDQLQNLYIANDKNNDIMFDFIYDGNKLTIDVKEKV